MLTEKQVINILCLQYEVSKEQIFKLGHQTVQADSAKQILIKWYADIKNLSIRDIQNKFGYKVPHAVLHALKKSEDYIMTDHVFRNVWYMVCDKIQMQNQKHEKTVLKLICQYFNTKKEQLKIPTHIPHISTAKQILTKWYKEVGRLSYPQIASKMCHKDHTSAMHAYNRANAIIDTEMKIKKFWYRLPGVDVYPQITALKFRP